MDRVLVAHPDRSVRRLLAAGAADVDVVVAVDATAASARLRTERLDAVLLDSGIVLGGHDAVAREIRAELRARDIPAAVLAEGEAEAALLEEGLPEAAACLTAPTDIAESARILHWVCGRSAPDAVDALRLSAGERGAGDRGAGERGNGERGAGAGSAHRESADGSERPAASRDDLDYARWSTIADAVARLQDETSKVRFATEALLHAVRGEKDHWLAGAQRYLADAIPTFQTAAVRDMATIQHAAEELGLPLLALGQSLRRWPVLAPAPLDYILSEHAAALSGHARALRRVRAELRTALDAAAADTPAGEAVDVDVDAAVADAPAGEAADVDAQGLTTAVLQESAFCAITELVDALPLGVIHEFEGEDAPGRPGAGPAIVLDSLPGPSDVEQLEGSHARHERISVELGPALRAGAISVYTQPIVRLASAEHVGAEALARWHHPELGEVPPDEFVPIAEETGLIEPLGLAVLERACRHFAHQAGRGQRIHVAVNVSARQLTSPTFRDRLADVLSRTGMPESSLSLEITERAFIGGHEGIVQALHDLRDLGVGIALDDFGTGYSCLSLIRTLPIDVLKVDRLFIAGVAGNRTDAAIVESIVRMANALGIPTVAEGVETEAQRDVLVELGCEYGQGFLFARPEPLDPWL